MDWQDELRQFTSTEQYYRYMLGFLLTDGAKFVAEKAGCYWLIDILCLTTREHRNEEFQVYKITVNEDNSFIISVEDGNGNKLKKHNLPMHGPFTDFPLKTFTFWVCRSGDNWVIMLPSEY